MIVGSVKASQEAYNPNCEHCRGYKDGMACAFHSASAEHMAGRCAGRLHNRPDQCFFCPPYLSQLSRLSTQT